MRAQAAIEYVLITAVLLGFVVSVMIVGLKENELSIALASVRQAEGEYSAMNSSIFFSSIGYEIDGRKVLLKPSFFVYGVGADVLPGEFKTLALEQIRQSLSPSGPAPQGNCFNAANYDYCFQGG